MGRNCTVCLHESRDEIDRALVGGTSNTSLSRQFGLTEQAVRRHAHRHIPQAAIRGEMQRRVTNLVPVAERVERLVQRLEGLADQANEARRGDELLRVARELRPALELLGRATGELKSDGGVTIVNQLGVSLDEARAAVEAYQRVSAIDEAMVAEQVMDFACKRAGSTPGYRRRLLERLRVPSDMVDVLMAEGEPLQSERLRLGTGRVGMIDAPWGSDR